MIYLEIDHAFPYNAPSTLENVHHSTPPRIHSKERVKLAAKSKSYAKIQREATAYREAGHAAAAWKQGVLLESLSINKRGQKIKENAWNQPLTGIDAKWVEAARPDMLIERLAFICLAGPAAERRRLPRVPRESSHQKRIRNAEALLGHISDSREARLKKKLRLESQVEAMFQRPDVWSSIEQLAEALLKRGTISGKETVHILEGAE
jgi:hypothetical protein